MEPVVFVTGPLAVNTLILPAGPGRCFILDPGGDPASIIAYVRAEGLSPAAFVLTHGHWDHLAALPELARQWPDAAVLVHRADSLWLGEGAVGRHRSFFETLGAGSLVDAAGPDLPEANDFLEEGGDCFGWKVFHTPGHSPGSVSLYRETDQILVSGDTLFRSGYGRTDGPGGSDRELADSLRRLLALPPSTRVYPGHGKPTDIGTERAGYSL